VTAKIILSIFLFCSLSYSDGIKKDSPFIYNQIDTSSITQKELESVYLVNYQNGISMLPSILMTVQKRDGLNINQLYLECNDVLFESIFKGTIVEKINNRNGISRFISDCRKIVLQQKFNRILKQ